MTNVCLVVHGYDINQPMLVILTNLIHSVSQITKQYENDVSYISHDYMQQVSDFD